MAESALQRRTAEQAERVRRAREQLPICTAALDEFRAIFGDGCALEWAEEGTVRFRQRGPEGVSPVIRRTVKDKEGKVATEAMKALRQRELIA